MSPLEALDTSPLPRFNLPLDASPKPDALVTPKSPDVVEALAPDEIEILPPSSAFPVPPSRTISPPAVLPLPEETTTFPPLPPVEAPLVKDRIPPTRLSDDPTATSMLPA